MGKRNTRPERKTILLVDPVTRKFVGYFRPEDGAFFTRAGNPSEAVKHVTDGNGATVRVRQNKAHTTRYIAAVAMGLFEDGSTDEVS